MHSTNELDKASALVKQLTEQLNSAILKVCNDHGCQVDIVIHTLPRSFVGDERVVDFKKIQVKVFKEV